MNNLITKKTRANAINWLSQFSTEGTFDDVDDAELIRSLNAYYDGGYINFITIKEGN